jgi:hypothetical protein
MEARAGQVPLGICHDYGCRVQNRISFDDTVFDDLARTLRAADDAASERHAVAAVVARMYVEAGKQTPIWRDHGGDLNDDTTVEGSMDCIDHASNTTTFLGLLQARGLLRFHRLAAPARRGVFAQHWAAVLVERETGEAFTVDSWFYEFGTPAVVMPLADWKAGRRPPGIIAGFR